MAATEQERDRDATGVTAVTAVSAATPVTPAFSNAATTTAVTDSATATATATGTSTSSSAASASEKKGKKIDKEAAKARKAAESVTDYKAEKEIDLKKAAAAVAALSSNTAALKNEGLFQGDLVDTEVATIMDELDFDRENAEKFLRRNGGNLVQAVGLYLATHKTLM